MVSVPDSLKMVVLCRNM